MTAAKLIDIFLMPGEFFVGDAQYRVRTLLGSCVSITLWHPATRIGAMSHFLLPGHGRRKQDRPSDKPGMYGADAMRLMVEGMAQHGVHVVSESLFGEGHRQLIFTIRSGEVLSRQVPPEPAWSSTGTGNQA